MRTEFHSGIIPPRNIGFFLMPGFSDLSLSAATNALEEANRLDGQNRFLWSLYSLDGQTVRSDCGVKVDTLPIEPGMPRPDLAFVVTARHCPLPAPGRLLAWLRNLAAHGTALGGILAGADILAEAGLLNGCRAARHWEDAAASMESYPDVMWSRAVYEIDRNRYTCAGGIAAFDLMLKIIRQAEGNALSTAVSNQLLHERARSARDLQQGFIQLRPGQCGTSLLNAIRYMEDHLEELGTLDDVAAAAGLSRRQLERKFGENFGMTPAVFYRELRLNKARTLLLNTSLPIAEVGMATGFVSQSHLAKRYRERFGLTPRQERRSAG